MAAERSRPRRPASGTGPRGRRRLWALLSAMAAAACPGPPRPGPEELALVDGEPVTAADVRARWRAGPPEVRLRAMERGGRHYLLDLAIDDLLLLREARRRGLRPTFSDLEPVHREWMTRLLEAEFEPTVSPAGVPEAAVRAEYERLRDELERPEQVHVELGYCETRERAEEAVRLALAAQARGAEGELRRVLVERTRRGPPGTSERYGGVYAMGQAEQYLGEEVARAAFSLAEGEEVFPEPVPFMDGWALVVVGARNAPSATSFEEAEPQLRQRLFGAFRDGALDRFVESFRGRHRVVVHEEAFDLVDWAGPRLEPPSPPDGGLPEPVPGSSGAASTR